MKSLALVVISLISFASSHTWVQCTNYDSTTGNCAGFIRNWVARNTPTPVVDDYYTWKNLGENDTQALCKTDTQAYENYTSQYPMASAYPGDVLNVMYSPNGHSAPGDPGLSTTSRIHWTGVAGTQLQTRGDLSTSNQLASWPFGQNCATTGDVASLPCSNGFTIPDGTSPGVYSFYWYWPYDKNPGQVPYGEEYFSCFEVNILATTNAVVATSSMTPASSTSAAKQTPASSDAQEASGTDSAQCGSMLEDCVTFCAPAKASICQCDPSTGKKTVSCGAGDETSSGMRAMAFAGILALIALF